MRPGTWFTRAGWVLYGLSCVGWLCVVPYAPHRLVEVFPPDTRLITSHRGVSARWDEIAENALTQDSLAALDPEIATLIRRIGVRDLVLGRIDSRVVGEAPSWVVTAWLGGRALAARWWLVLRGDSRLTAQPLHGGRLKWTLDHAEFPEAGPLSFTLDEGVLIAVIGHDDSALNRAIAAADGHQPWGFPFEPSWDETWLLDPNRVDRAWLATTSYGSLRVDVERLDAERTTLEILSSAPFVGRPLETPDGLDQLDSLLGNVARTVVQGSGSAWGHLVGLGFSGPVAESMAALARIQGDESLVVCMLGGEYGGRLQGLRIPALLVAMPRRRGDDAASVVQPMLHAVNARTSGEWHLRPVSNDESVRYVIERMGSMPAEPRPRGEQIAVAELESWVLLTTSRESLERLFARGGWATEHVVDRSSSWSSRFPADTGCLYGWADLERTGKSLRNVLAVYTLSSMQDSTGIAEDKAAQASIARGWLQRVQRLGTVKCRMEPTSSGTRFLVDAGPTYAEVGAP